MKENSEGDTGHLVYKGKSLVSWEKISVERPWRERSDVSVFVSYAHEWFDDAAYIAQVFETHGLNVWIDSGELRTGDKLGSRLLREIEKADYFVTLISPEYFASPWCVRELETAAAKGKKILPIKVSEGDLVLSPHIRNLYEKKLGDPVFLDIRRRNPAANLNIARSLGWGTNPNATSEVSVTLHVGVHEKTLTPTYSLVGAASAAKKFWFNLRD